MSDAVAAPAAEQVPVAPVAPEGAVAPDTQPAPVTPAVNARQLLAEMKAGKAPVVPHWVNEPRKENGEWKAEGKPGDVAEPAPEAVAPPPTEGDAAPAAGEGPADAPAAVDAVPEGMVRIEVPADLHRNFGTHRDVPKADEEWVRWNLNNTVRKRQVEQVEASAREILNENLLLRAQVEAFRSPASDPAEAQALAEIEALKADGRPEAVQLAQVLEAGVAAARQKRIDAALASQREKIGAAETEQAALRFVEGAYATAKAQLPAWYTASPKFEQAFALARQSYGALLTAQENAGRPVDLSVDDFISAHLLPLYLRDPDVLSRSKQDADVRAKAEADRLAREATEKATAEAAQRERERLEAAARARAANVPGRLPAGVGAPTPSESVRPQSAREIMAAVHGRRPSLG